MVNKSSILFLFREGYGLIVLPLNLLSFATTTYYLMIGNIPFLKTLFPDFWVYLLAGIVGGLPMITLLGRFYVKSSWYKASAKNNPYSYLLVPASFPLYRAISRICEKEGLLEDAKILEDLVKSSEVEEFNAV